MANTYQVKKKAIGGYAVTYNCPHCKSGLTSKLSEAGTSQPCPTCSKSFVVPGKSELDQLKAKELQRRAKESEEKELAKQRQLAVADDWREQEERVRAEEEALQKFRDSHCPYCWEEIRPAVKKCKHCHELLDPELRLRAAKQEVTGVTIPLEQMFWLVVKFWAASLLFGIMLGVFGFIMVVVLSGLAGYSLFP